MNQQSNKKSESVIKANASKKTGTKKQYRNINTYPLTNENLNVFNIRNETTSESSKSSLDNDPDDDDETVITDYVSNPYGLTTPPPPPNDEMDVDDYEAPPTELLTREGKKMFYEKNGIMEPVTSSNYNREMIIYDENGNEILRKEHLPEKRVYYNDIMDEDVKIGGKRVRKTKRKTIRKTKRKTRKTRRYRRRHTKKYK